MAGIKIAGKSADAAATILNIGKKLKKNGSGKIHSLFGGKMAQQRICSNCALGNCSHCEGGKSKAGFYGGWICTCTHPDLKPKAGTGKKIARLVIEDGIRPATQDE